MFRYQHGKPQAAAPRGPRGPRHGDPAGCLRVELRGGKTAGGRGSLPAIWTASEEAFDPSLTHPANFLLGKEVLTKPGVWLGRKAALLGPRFDMLAGD